MSTLGAKGFFITGTDTDVGKTVVTAALLKLLKAKGYQVAAAKPFESGGSSDSHWLHREAEQPDAWHKLAFPYRLKAAMAPDLAAQKEGVLLSTKLAITGLHQLQSMADILLVEGAGGVLVPIRKHIMVADFAAELGFPVLVVARLTLGTINHTLLTLEALRHRGCQVAGVIFSQTESGALNEVQKNNPRVIAELGRVSVLGHLPYLPKARRLQLPVASRIERFFLLKKLLALSGTR